MANSWRSAAWAFWLIGCSSIPEPVNAAQCAAIRTFYIEAQTAMIDKGSCDDADSIEQCVPHVALREAYIESLEANRCQSMK